MIDDVLTMIPGPTPVHPRVLRRMAEATVSHQYPSFVEDYKSCLKNYLEIMEFPQGRPFVLAGGGTLAMEMAVVNLVDEGEKLLIINHGYFGDRFGQIADAFGIEYEMISAPWGRVVAAEDLENKLNQESFAAVTITHVDTSSGSCSPIADYCEVLRGRDELVILDGVCASAGERENCGELGVDVVFTAPQKAFGAPPGLAMLIASERAMNKRKGLKAKRSYYADLERWLPIMENPGGYFSTSAVNAVRGLKEATDIILEEGLEKRYARHAALARGFRAGAAAMGLLLFTDATCLANTLSVLHYPDKADDASFRAEMLKNGVVVAGGLGPVAGKAFRAGHMGNIGREEICEALMAIEKSLVAGGITIETGTAVAAAAPHLSW